jgi:hypothetical protein
MSYVDIKLLLVYHVVKACGEVKAHSMHSYSLQWIALSIFSLPDSYARKKEPTIPA